MNLHGTGRGRRSGVCRQSEENKSARGEIIGNQTVQFRQNYPWVGDRIYFRCRRALSFVKSQGTPSCGRFKGEWRMMHCPFSCTNVSPDCPVRADLQNSCKLIVTFSLRSLALGDLPFLLFVVERPLWLVWRDISHFWSQDKMIKYWMWSLNISFFFIYTSPRPLAFWEHNPEFRNEGVKWRGILSMGSSAMYRWNWGKLVLHCEIKKKAPRRTNDE